MLQIGDLLADMGGQVGLWMGLSVLTIFEILELVFGLACISGKKMRPKNAKTAWAWAAEETRLRVPKKTSVQPKMTIEDITKMMKKNTIDPENS